MGIGRGTSDRFMIFLNDTNAAAAAAGGASVKESSALSAPPRSAPHGHQAIKCPGAAVATNIGPNEAISRRGVLAQI